MVPTPAPVKIRFKVNPTPGSHGAGMGSASKGKRVASGPIGGKAKHARIGMFLLILYSTLSVRECWGRVQSDD